MFENKNGVIQQMVQDFLVPLLTNPNEWDLVTLIDSFIDAVSVYQEDFLPNKKVSFEASDGFKTLKVFVGVSADGNTCSSINISEGKE